MVQGVVLHLIWDSHIVSVDFAVVGEVQLHAHGHGHACLAKCRIALLQSFGDVDLKFIHYNRLQLAGLGVEGIDDGGIIQNLRDIQIAHISIFSHTGEQLLKGVCLRDLV